jgi:hypothetical protein
MRVLKSMLLVSTLVAGTAFSSTGSVSALPLGAAATGTEMSPQIEDISSTIQVGSRRSARIAAGIIGGAIIGGLLASHYYRHYYYYEPYPVYPLYPRYYAYRGYPIDAAIAYCMRRFRSYDPYSMTYLGYDGLRHRCP